jgi:hypothetical protein
MVEISSLTKSARDYDGANGRVGGNQMLRKLLLSIVAIVGLSVVSVSPVLAGGTWTDVATTGLPAAATKTGLCNPLLLTDGTVLVQGCVSNAWYKLTPDIHGNYSSGTWSVTGSLPSNYKPEWFASAVLPDGRVIVEGGEYDIATCNMPPKSQTWISLGAIYDPITGLWTKVDPPSGTAWTTAWSSVTAWQNTQACGSVLYNGGIGDAPSIVLPTANSCSAPAAPRRRPMRFSLPRPRAGASLVRPTTREATAYPVRPPRSQAIP